jgi:uncharacterized protein YndB with AHSA1/START domain
MPDIFHDLVIGVKRGPVFAAITTPAGLDAWWTKTSAGAPNAGSIYELGFGPGFDWRGRVTDVAPNQVFELQMIEADPDWMDSRIRFELSDAVGSTRVRFRHMGWSTCNEHYCVSCYCWAMYLRVLRRHLEKGEQVAYEDRLTV